MQVTVTNVDKVPGWIHRGATHVITLLHSSERNHLFMPKDFKRENWLFLEMDDVVSPTADFAPKVDQVKRLLEWAKKLPNDAHLVVHCHAGVSRSTAAALAIKVQELGVNKIDEAVNWLLEARPQACPNPVITSIADDLLGANGELHAAAEEVANNKLLSLYGGRLASRNRLKEQLTMYTYACKVINIVDGDTIDIELDLGFQIKMKERVRLLGVDTPEVFGPNAEAAGQVASDFSKHWVDERNARGVFVYESKKYNARDKYGRSLGYLVWKGTDGKRETLNEAIVVSGNVKK